MSRAAAIRLVSLLMRLARELRIWGLSSRPLWPAGHLPRKGEIGLHSGFCGSDCEFNDLRKQFNGLPKQFNDLSK